MGSKGSSPKKYVLRAVMLIAIIFTVVFIVNLNNGVTVQKQTTVVNGMNTTQIIKICNSNPVAIYGICQLSHNQANSNNTSFCPNGGIPTVTDSNNNLICPASVVQLSGNTTLPLNCPTGQIQSGNNCVNIIPPAPVYESIQLKPIVTFVDNNNLQTSAPVIAKNIQLGSLVAPQGTNTPFSNGKIFLQISVQ